MTCDSFLFYDSCIDKRKRDKKPGKLHKKRISAKNEAKQIKFDSENVNTRVNTQNIYIFGQKSSKGGIAMAKNIKEIMIALNQVLTTTVWVNEDRQIISLSDELKIGYNNAPRSIEDLPRTSLVGAYVSLQIRTDNFDVPAEGLDTKTLAQRVKEMVFSEAKKIIDAADGSAEGTRAMAA